MEPQTFALVGIILLAFGVLLLRMQKNQGGHAHKKSSGSDLTEDLTERARQGTLDPFAGREEEVERTIHILMRRTKNNPLLIGAPGVGKTAIAHGLAQRIASGDVPEGLKGKRVLALDLPSLMAETKYRGELEKRLRDFLASLEDQARENILFIDEIHMLAQAGGTEGALNVSDVFKPALARGELHVIGATTWNEYQTYIHPDAPLDRRFQPVLVDEPSPEAAFHILSSLRGTYEEFHGVEIPDATLRAAITLSDAYFKGRFLPDKGIDLIDEAAAKVSIDCSRAHHGATLGLVHAAASNKQNSAGKQKHTGDIVTTEDIQAVVDQWIAHADAERKHS